MKNNERVLMEKGLRTILPERSLPLDKLERYFDEITLWNPRYGLVNTSGEELVVKHFLDCAALVPQLTPLLFSRAADVGSGAGLPGIILALIFPEVEWSLIERSGKRCGFLENVVTLLGLSNVHIVNKPVEKVKECFDLITFRAFRSLAEPGLMGLLDRLLVSGGCMAAYKGRRETIQKEITAMDGFPSESFSVVSLSVPGLVEERKGVFYFKEA